MEPTPAVGHVSEIVLVRHGMTTRNAIREAGGFPASPKELLLADFLPDHQVVLSETGRKQAEVIGQILAEHLPDPHGYDAFLDSGYCRAVETLDRILAAFTLDPRAGGRRRSHLDLREREPGYTFNMTITQVATFFPWYLEYEAATGPFYARPPGGESVADVCARVHRFIDELRRNHNGQRVFLVTHGHVMRAFRFWLDQMSPADTDSLFVSHIPNCAVLRYQRVLREGAWTFVRDQETEQTVWQEFQARCGTSMPAS